MDPEGPSLPDTWEEDTDGRRNDRASPGGHRAAGQGADPREAPRPPEDQQPQRDADDGGLRPEQLDDRPGAQGAEGQGSGPRADLRGDRRGQARPGAEHG